jgi:polygalacturonase
MNAKSTILLALPLFGLLAIQAQTPIQAPPTVRDISWYTTNCPFPMQAPMLPVFPDRDFPLTDYGAISDGHTLNTLAFQKAIHACSDAGGGRVVVPAGQWLTGPIELLSHVNLYLAPDARILFTNDHTQYPLITGHGYSVSVTPPLYGHDLEDIAITGEGSFDGAGESWRPVKREKMTAAQWSKLLSSGGSLSGDGKIWWPSREARDGDAYLRSLKRKSQLTTDDFLPARDYLRPCLLDLVNCRHILIRGILLANSPKFVFYPNHCSDLTMDHVRIFNEWWAQNGDGIDISACKNVLLYQCTVSAGDDGICMKSSGTLPDGPALRNVIIAGCTVYRAHGGFVIGSNTDGGMHDIFVSDCNFVGTDVGLRFKSNMGRGGLVDDIFITGITMRNIVHEAVLFDTYYENVEAGAEKDPNKPRPEDKTPEFRDFRISRVICNGAHTGISITGLPQMPVSRIFFDSLDIHSDKGLVATQARDIELHAMKWVVQNEPVYDADKTAEIRIRP